MLSLTANILQMIRRAKSPLSKADIAEKASVSLSAVSGHIERLMEERLIQVSNIGISSGGRKPKQYSLNSSYGFILSIELGTTSVQAALTDFNCQIVASKSSLIQINQGPEVVLTHTYQLIEQLMGENSVQVHAIKGIGIGIPGPVEFSTGCPISPPLMPGWDGYPIKAFWSTYFECPCYIDNDVNIMALGEYTKGLNFEVEHLIFIKIDTGIGSGVIYDGKLYRGATGSAGDIGHFDIGTDVVCWCGNSGCLEASAGGKAITAMGKELALLGKSDYLLKAVQDEGSLTLDHIAAGLQGLDSVSIELVRESGIAIGRVIASIVNFSNPSLIAIGGSVPEFGDLFLAALRQSVYQRSLPLATRNLVINKSILGTKVGLIGGAYMTIDELIIQGTNDRTDINLG
jgi:predicted NBD/HSP70 family sugar kinase